VYLYVVLVVLAGFLVALTEETFLQPRLHVLLRISSPHPRMLSLHLYVVFVVLAGFLGALTEETLFLMQELMLTKAHLALLLSLLVHVELHL
jgi:H+/Cl- antiporter ClcA